MLKGEIFLLGNIFLDGVEFHSNHSSNTVKSFVELSRDKNRMVHLLKRRLTDIDTILLEQSLSRRRI